MTENHPSTASPTIPPHGTAPLPMAVRQRLQKLFEHAQGCTAKADYDYAIDSLTQCVVEDPGNLIYLQHLLANLAQRSGGNKKGGRFSSLRTKGSRMALNKAAARGAWREAFQAGCDALKQHPWDTTTLLALADACQELGHQECELYYQRWALDADPKDPVVNRHLALSLARMGHFDQAIACWRRVEQAKPNDQEAYKAISQLSVERTIQRGGYDEEMIGEDGVKQDMSVAQLSARTRAASGGQPAERDAAGQSAAQAGGPRDADAEEARLAAAIKSDPANVDNYLRLAERYAQRDQLSIAERLLNKAMAASGGSLRVREQLEDVQLRRARQQVDVAVRRAKTEQTAEAVELARRMEQQANQAELEIYASRSAREPANVQLQYELGLRLKRAGKFPEAIQAFQAARSDTRRHAIVQLHLGECFQSIRQFKLAMSSYTAAVEASKQLDLETQKLALYRAGVLAAEMKDLGRAEGFLTDLAEIDFGYRDVAARLDKLASLRDSV